MCLCVYVCVQSCQKKVACGRVRKIPMCEGSVERPPERRAATQFAGLTNTKNAETCYQGLNSLLQTLFMTPEIRETIFSIEREVVLYGGTLPCDDLELYRLSLPCELQRLLAYLQAADVDGVQTNALTHSFDCHGFDTSSHLDLQELMRILFDALETSFSEIDQVRVKEIYTGSFVQQVKCLKCGNCSNREECFSDLNIPVDGFDGIISSLSAFITPEHLRGDNKYHCTKCNQHVDARKQMRLRKLSQVMILSLDRFQMDWDGVREKLMDRFTFPQELDFAQYMEEPVITSIY